MILLTRSILFVDDYDMLRRIYMELLSDAGYRVMGAANADECMASLACEIPDLILLDIMMKPVDGWATLRMIRSFPPSSGIPIIMISGKAILPQEVTQYGPLIDGYMRKPLQNAFLISSIAEYFSWFDSLRDRCEAAITAGRNPDDVALFFTLKRQERSVHLMYWMIKTEYEKNRDPASPHILIDAFNSIEAYIADMTEQIQVVESHIC